MTPLRRRMIGDLELRGYSERTVEAYVRAVVQLARFYSRSPDRLTEEQVRDYLLHLAGVQKVARGKLLYLLERLTEVSVSDLSELLGVSVSAVSQHLAKLKA